MSEKETKVTKQETLAALRNPGELYVIMSAATKMPFVKCDEETFDDEIFLYYQMEDAKDKARKLLDEKYVSAVAKLAKEQLLPFFTSLYIMGVNALAVNSGTDMEITVQLSDLVTRNIPKELPEGKQIVENPALHLTAAYFMQELRKQEQPQMTEELKELQEELLAHYGKGTFLIPVEENGQIPILKQKDGSLYQPVFTDVLEFQKFTKGRQIGSCSGGKDRRIADGRCKRRCAESSRSECAASGGTKKERVNGRISSVFEKRIFQGSRSYR